MKNVYEIWDILTDIIQSINKSKYSSEIVFRGAYVLRAFLNQKGYPTMRYTEDIDMDWVSNRMWKEFYDELPDLLTRNSKLGIRYNYSARSKGFSNKKMKLILDANFSNITRIVSIDLSQRITDYTLELEINSELYKMGSLYESICDKLEVFNTHRVGGRIKDFYDLCLISHFDGLSLYRIKQVWDSRGNVLPTPIFGISPDNFGRMRKGFDIHKEERFDNIDFEDAMQRVLNFVTVIYEIILDEESGENIFWNRQEEEWYAK